MAVDRYENDPRIAGLTMTLLGIMSVVCTFIILAAVLSTRACAV